MVIVPAGGSMGRAETDPGEHAEPFTRLYDAPEGSAVPLNELRLSEEHGWRRVEEDDTAHRFAQCAVMMNDRLVAVLRRDSPDVDLYARQSRRLKLCARLQPVCDGRTDSKRTSVARSPSG